MTILGFIIVAIGAIMVMKTEWFLSNFGRIAWFEEHMGSDGGSRLGYKVFGIAAIFIGTLVMTDMIGSFMGWLLSPLLKYSRIE